MRVTTLIGVYNARGTITGEISYLFTKVTGRGHCSLCDITHGWLGRRRTFDDCASTLPCPFELYHLDDQPEAVRLVSADRTPIVVAVLDDGSVHELLSTSDLEAFDSSPERLIEGIDRAMQLRGWTTA
jgi:hypothetical protein